MENNNEYAAAMAGFPPEFCDDVIPELVHFKVWVNGICPTDVDRSGVAKGQSAGASSSKDGAPAKGGGENKGKEKGKGKGGKTKSKY